MTEGHGATKLDPAVENANTWREQHYLRFRWTRANVKAAVWGFVIIPVSLYAAVNYTHNKWRWNGKLKQEKLSD